MEYYHKSKNAASICTWSLELKFVNKEQVFDVVEKLGKFEHDLHIEIEPKDDESFLIMVYNMSWAANLVEVAKLIEECDFSWEEEDE